MRNQSSVILSLVFFILLFTLKYANASSKEGDLEAICSGQESAWPSSSFEMTEFASQFKNLDLKCFHTLLGREPDSGADKRFQYLLDSKSLEFIQPELVEEICSDRATYYMKAIPVDLLLRSFAKAVSFQCLLDLMEHQKRYYLPFDIIPRGFEEFLVDHLSEKLEDLLKDFFINPLTRNPKFSPERFHPSQSSGTENSTGLNLGTLSTFGGQLFETNNSRSLDEDRDNNVPGFSRDSPPKDKDQSSEEASELKIQELSQKEPDVSPTKISWIKSPIWLCLGSRFSPEDVNYYRKALSLLLQIGEEVEKTGQELKAAFILTLKRVLINSFDAEQCLGDDFCRDLYKFTEKITNSIPDENLRSVCNSFEYPRCMTIFKSHSIDERAFYVKLRSLSIKILWKHLNSIGDSSNAALIINDLYERQSEFKGLFPVLKASNADCDLIAALFNVRYKHYRFFNTENVIDMFDGFKKSIPSKLDQNKDHIQRLVNDFADFNLVELFSSKDLFAEKKIKIGDKKVDIKTLLSLPLDLLRDSINQLESDEIIKLLKTLANRNALSEDIQKMSRFCNFCCPLLEKIQSLPTDLGQELISKAAKELYFLLPCATLTNLGFLSNRLSLIKPLPNSIVKPIYLADLYILYFEQLQQDENVKTLEWLLMIHLGRRYLFGYEEASPKGSTIELLWTFMIALNGFTKGIKETDDEDLVSKEERDLYKLGQALQDFGEYKSVIDLKTHESFPCKWHQCVNELKLHFDTVVSRMPEELDPYDPKIGLFQIVELLDEYLTTDTKWETITGYAKSLEIDFMSIEEISNKLLNAISVKSNWSTQETQFVSNLLSCYLDTETRSECRQKLSDQFQSNYKALSDLAPFVSSEFLVWMPYPYKNVKEFRSHILHCWPKANLSLILKSGQNFLNDLPEYLKNPFFAKFRAPDVKFIQLGSHDFSSVSVQAQFKLLFEEKAKLFKKVGDGEFYAPCWALGDLASKMLGIVIGKYIQTATPLPISLDPSFIQLFFSTPNKQNIQSYYQKNYKDDLEDYKTIITCKNNKTDYEKDWKDLPIHLIHKITDTTFSEKSNIYPSEHSKATVMTCPRWEYITEKYPKLVDCYMLKRFETMIEKMRTGVSFFVNLGTISRAHNCKDLQKLLIPKNDLNEK